MAWDNMRPSNLKNVTLYRFPSRVREPRDGTVYSRRFDGRRMPVIDHAIHGTIFVQEPRFKFRLREAMFNFKNPNTPFIEDGTVVTYPEHGGFQHTITTGQYLYIVRDDRGEIVARVSRAGSPFGGFDWAEGVEMVEDAIKRAAADRNVIEEAERLKLYENEEFSRWTMTTMWPLTMRLTASSNGEKLCLKFSSSAGRPAVSTRTI